ncbi:MAG: IS66 family insertion sequence element accessory protein TnpB [Gammaproteobacteria bacterium]|nr:IS66 family insertion sequence element accessory protein TnpB [Gammaproteobacteria bacterium]MBU1723634.1 IS66 family insertion sequence element accessory protein TnpB [Gammaproteobacteria bacterium]MBU2005630.1 IS66 family insertion sequence element accessory protein TnpB [Gammaproteobacteria bacterium]
MNPGQDGRLAYWQAQLQRFQSSGLSGVQYCEQEQLSYHGFVYWRRKLCGTAGKPPGEGKRPVLPEPSGFVTVRPALPGTDARTGDGLELSLPNGLVIRNIHPGNVALLRRLLEQL